MVASENSRFFTPILSPRQAENENYSNRDKTEIEFDFQTLNDSVGVNK